MVVPTPKHLLGLKPYRPGKPIEELAREKQLKRIVKLASNENPLGPSPKAMAAMREAMAGIHRYPDAGAYNLVQALADRFGRPASEIVCGSGTDALLEYIVMAFSEPGGQVLTSAGSFIGMQVNTQKLARQLVEVPLRDYHFDLDALTAAIQPQTRILYLANPNNPTGSMFSKQEFEALMCKVPSEVLVVLDEAYYEYAKELPEYPNGLEYRFDNLIVTRTLSKIYGLAGIRVGFALGPESLIRELYKVKLPFEPNNLAQAAAIGALADDEFLTETITLNRRMLTEMGKRFDALGIPYVKSAANFLMLIFADENRATAFSNACLNRGLIVRHVGAFGVPNGVRINTGTEDETHFALEVIEQVHPLCGKVPHG